MRIVTPPYMQSFLSMDDIIGEVKKVPVIRTKKGFSPCPHCGGAAHQEEDKNFVVLSCIHCGYNRPVRSEYARTL